MLKIWVNDSGKNVCKNTPILPVLKGAIAGILAEIKFREDSILI